MALLKVTHQVVIEVSSVKFVNECSKPILLHLLHVIIVVVCVVFPPVNIHAFYKELVNQIGLGVIFRQLVVSFLLLREVGNEFVAEGGFC